ncbi:hypothetical protein MUY27_13125 [Mucilaginibacter sp. RS28]|uniref:Uncharacterized protein n=1 Tax=Mucilaginibacter straminoryzae TaxID=2932774 RepID=A0A9X1X3P8_9SPHI|nr:hypothetical protein [Mucilaginibacter straminoryzae]MCJ8210652.1 hypothetical protein [Mucilaginibacter straminoryzae]
MIEKASTGSTTAVDENEYYAFGFKYRVTAINLCYRKYKYGCLLSVPRSDIKFTDPKSP